MAHNSKRNRRDTTTQDGDDYVYPTAKVRETKTRDRRSGKNQIRKGLIDIENQEFDDCDEDTSNLADWYDDTPMASNEDIAAELDDDITDDDAIYGTHWDIHDDLMEDCGYDWEDY